MNLAKQGQFNFSFFKVDFQNPKFNIEYLVYRSQDLAQTQQNLAQSHHHTSVTLELPGLFYTNLASLVFHEDVVKYAVEDCIEEVCCAEVEDEDVGDCSHLVVAWQDFNNLNRL